MKKTETIRLQHPVKSNGATLEELTMRRPLVRDLRAAQRTAGPGAPKADVEVALFASLCEVAPEALDGLDLGDYHRVQETYEGFLSHGSTSAPPAAS